MNNHDLVGHACAASTLRYFASIDDADPNDGPVSPTEGRKGRLCASPRRRFFHYGKDYRVRFAHSIQLGKAHSG
jgi:hypothetical protein